MAGYEDTRQKIISTLMGRPNGTEIQPENHQDYALNMLDYIRGLELIATSTLIGIAESNTTPVQPNSSRVCYIAGVAQNQTVVFENFIDENGNPISVTTGDMEGIFVILMWNTQYWSAQTFSTNIISKSESATFYYRYNIRKTYESVALMNADVVSPIGIDGKYIKIGDIVTVVNSVTPSENGIYSYEGAADGWKFQSSMNFSLIQNIGSNTNVAMSQKSILDLVGGSFSFNGFIQTSGSFSSDVTNTRKCTDYLRISLDCDLIFYSESNNQYVNAISFYDIDKKFISGISNNQSSINIQTITKNNLPSNCVYIRVSTLTSLLNNSFIYFGDFQSLIKDVEKKFSVVLNLIYEKISIQPGKNLFNKDSNYIILNKCLYSNGSLLDNSSFFVSDYISVVPNSTYSHSNFDVGGAFCCVYDINLNSISSFKNSPVTIPSNGYFVRMSGVKTSLSIQQFELGDSVTSYAPYVEYYPLEVLKNTLQSEIDTLNVVVSNKLDKVVGKNKYDPQSWVEGQWVTSDGSIQSVGYGIGRSGYIPISSGQTLTAYQTDSFYQCRACLYDANKNPISGSVTVDTIASSRSITWQTGAAYAVFTFRSYPSESKKSQIELGNSFTYYKNYNPYTPIETLQSEIDTLNVVVSNKLDKVVGKNKFNPNAADILVGYYIGSNGEYNSNPYGINTSGFIEISEGQTLKANFDVGNTYVALYDANKNYVAGSAVNANVITWQTGAAYARFSYYTPVNNYQIEVGTTSTTYEPYTIYGFMGNVTMQIPDRETVCVLPKKMYFVKGKQSCIYHENVLLKNLNDPTTLFFNKGINYNRQTTFNFAASSTNQTLSSQIIRSFKKGQLKSITYDVIDPTVNNGKVVNALHIGDSFTDIGSWVKETKNLLNSQGVTYNLLGTCGNSTFRAEGLSGGTLANTFLNSSSGVGRRVQVTGITTLPSTSYPGRTYRDSNGKDWTVRSGKIDSNGNGYIVVTKFGAVENDFNNFPSSGTLTKQDAGEGDNIINYTNPTPCFFNPFINPSTGSLDITNYINTWGFEIPNLILFQFTWNDTNIWSSDSSLNSLVASFKLAADHIHSAYPNAKIILSIEPFGSINGNLDWNGKKYTVLRLTELLLIQFEDDLNYNSWVKIAPSYAFVDLVNGYGGGASVVPCERYPSITEVSGGDGVHPNTGMLQIADCVSQIVSAII